MIGGTSRISAILLLRSSRLNIGKAIRCRNGLSILLKFMTQHDVPHLLAVLVALLAATKVLGLLAQRLGQPSVVGELVAGIILGSSLFGIIDPANPIIDALAELGVIVLLFGIGLHTDIRALARVGGEAMAVAVVGVVLPFALGYGVSA